MSNPTAGVASTELTVMATLRAKPNCVDEVRTALLSLVAPTRAEAGCLTYVVQQSCEDAAVFGLYEVWRSKADLDAHFQKPYFQKLVARQGEVLSEPPQIRLFSAINTASPAQVRRSTVARSLTSLSAAFALLFVAATFVRAEEARTPDSRRSAEIGAPVNRQRTAEPSTCHIQPLTIRTTFPHESQARGEYGKVILTTSIDKDGRAADTRVTRSSGYHSLDAAAMDSVGRYWRFDISSCASTELPTTSEMTLSFQRAPTYTVSGTVNRHRANLANTTPDLKRCDVVSDVSGDSVIACAVDVAFAKQTGATIVADRAPSITQH
jgi:TonB family protein